MERNDPTFKKLQQIERLIDLKRDTEKTKEEVLKFVISQTEPLKERSQEVDFLFGIDEHLSAFITKFDDKIQEIEDKLMNIAA